ncbi:MAG: substrate-binding domain-containing protein [Planctomycetota bacterium]
MKDKILADICKGIWKVGDKLPVEAELKKRYSVSQTTLTKAMELLVDFGVVRRKRRVGTFVASLSEVSTNNPETLYLVGITQKVLNRDDDINWFISNEIYKAVINNWEGRIKLVDRDEIVEELFADGNAGVISCEQRKSVTPENIPWVTIFLGKTDDAPGKNAVLFDQVTSAKNAIISLQEKMDHKSIAIISGGLEPHADKFTGYTQALNELGILFNEELVVKTNGGGKDAGYKAMLELLDRDINFSAVYVDTDYKAAGALKALTEKGINVPSEISLLGDDNVPGLQECGKSLTTIDAGYQERGRAAVRMIMEVIRRKENIDSVSISGKVVESDTTVCLQTVDAQ